MPSTSQIRILINQADNIVYNMAARALQLANDDKHLSSENCEKTATTWATIAIALRAQLKEFE